MLDPGLKKKSIQLNWELLSTTFSNLDERWSAKASGRKEKRNSSRTERGKSVQLHISGRDVIQVVLPLVSLGVLLLLLTQKLSASEIQGINSSRVSKAYRWNTSFSPSHPGRAHAAGSTPYRSLGNILVPGKFQAGAGSHCSCMLPSHPHSWKPAWSHHCWAFCNTLQSCKDPGRWDWLLMPLLQATGGQCGPQQAAHLPQQGNPTALSDSCGYGACSKEQSTDQSMGDEQTRLFSAQKKQLPILIA